VTGDGLRIALLAPPWFPVPPPAYGGIEAVVALLADGLADAGHAVTLFASGDSSTRAELCAVYDQAPSEHIGSSLWELRHAAAYLERAGEFDVLHDHTGLVGLLVSAFAPGAAVHTVHGPVGGEPGELYAAVCRRHPHARLISISRNQQRRRPDLPWLANVPNAVDVESYPLGAAKEGYLLFLGRMSPEKGCHLAIEVARAAGLPLRIAGKKREPLEEAYFDRFVRPCLGGGVEYLGEVSEAEKRDLLAGALATLFTIDWEEPFGLVMIESMACGTPVLATRRGSVPEVVEDGVTGFVADDYRDLAAFVDRAAALDPREIRGRAAARFSPGRLVEEHVAAYRLALELGPAAGRPRPGAAGRDVLEGAAEGSSA